MPATTALTAAASTGLTPRTSSREATALCSRHGTSAAAAMQIKTAAARSSDNSPSTTRTASAMPGSQQDNGRMPQPVRPRRVEGRRSSFYCHRAGSSRSGSHGQAPGVSPLSHISGLAVRLGVERLAASRRRFVSRPQDNLPKRQQDYRYDKWRNIIEHAEQQHPRQQVLPVHLPQADQHGGVEHAEPAGGMAGKAQQRRRDEDDRDHDEAEVGFVRHQHIHRQRAETEIDNADRDLQQRQRTARQHHRPGPAADPARLDPDPDHIGRAARG